MPENRSVYVTLAFAGVALMVAMLIGVVVLKKRSSRYPHHQVRVLLSLLFCSIFLMLHRHFILFRFLCLFLSKEKRQLSIFSASCMIFNHSLFETNLTFSENKYWNNKMHLCPLSTSSDQITQP